MIPSTIAITSTTPPPPLPPPHHLSAAISAATSLLHLKQLHAQILRTNPPSPSSPPLLFNLLLSSLRFPYSLPLFSSIPPLQPHLYNNLFRRLSRSTTPQNALLFFETSRKKDCVVDRFGFPPLLKAAAKAGAVKEGIQMHCLICKLGFHLDPFVQTSLVMLYASCGKITEARLMFDKMSQRDIVTWNILIDGYGHKQINRRSLHF